MEMEEKSCAACHRTKVRGAGEKKGLLSRLHRIEGQVRGLSRMVEEDAYCVDILTQTAAAGAAIDAFRRELLAAHIRGCVATDLREGRTETAEELIAVLEKLMK